ncbi:MAG: hypothetical protein ABS87_10865 [Sphingomonas sp. SCN 67-18]|uniref:PEPxxWA-CTERM sorting domain-containing protein n=1 Tax=uncultured Sphingomonas sp. TaxID=158754 RepID=UPI00086962FE|nr:PEPxxWA-CTERM sorting domain-containing protein [Sphingomonas sp. SCN 67-18]ODU20530.1 MAG: hypothetical protein ABS87_10865 [Sphingomonas sp. SCN 67-18]
MLRPVLLASAALALALPAAAASAATIINLDGQAHSSISGSAANVVNFGPGTYKVTFTQDQFTAFSRWSSNAGCDGAGENCRQGWELSAAYDAGNGVTQFGDANGGGNYGPTVTPDNGFYANETLAFDAGSGVYSSTFTLTQATDVRFFIFDDNIGDNRGGISLSVSAVPEPATWAMMIGGFGLVGGVMRRRAVRTTVTYA